MWIWTMRIFKIERIKAEMAESNETAFFIQAIRILGCKRNYPRCLVLQAITTFNSLQESLPIRHKARKKFKK